MAEFVLDDDNVDASQESLTPVDAGGGGSSADTGDNTTTSKRLVALKYVPDFVNGQGAVIAYNMMLWHYGPPSTGYFKEVMGLHTMTTEQVELFEAHRPNLSSNVNLISDSPKKKLKGINLTSGKKPEKCVLWLEAVESPLDLRQIYHNCASTFDNAPAPKPGKYDNNFKPYKLTLAYGADEMIAHAKIVEPRFTLTFSLSGEKNIIARNAELFFRLDTFLLFGDSPIIFKRATNATTQEKVYLHTMAEPTEIKEYLEPLVTVARKLEFNVTFSA